MQFHGIFYSHFGSEGLNLDVGENMKLGGYKSMCRVSAPCTTLTFSTIHVVGCIAGEECCLYRNDASLLLCCWQFLVLGLTSACREVTRSSL